MPAEVSQTLHRGLCVLELLAREPDGATVTELAARLGTNRTVTYRLVTTLEQHALVRRDARGRVLLGLGVLPLAMSVQPMLRDVAVPVLRVLADRVGATSHLTVAEGDEALALAVVEPSRTMFHVAYRVGTRHPVSQGAGGRAILLARRGLPAAYAVSAGELQTGARGLAAPIRGVEGLAASVGIVTLGEEIDTERVAPAVVQAAAEIAAALR